jgi:2',3'-cyclic-nucleotide 2'-phosphodiesterase (5'-nucleotidase family)
VRASGWGEYFIGNFGAVDVYLTVARGHGVEHKVAGTGDDTSPGVLALATEGRQSLSFFEAVEPDVETFGNHDFDYGPDATRAIVSASPQTWVSANVIVEMPSKTTTVSASRRAT